MKKLVLVVVMLAILGISMLNCLDLIKLHEDKMSDTKIAISKENLIVSDDGNKTGFSITLLKYESGMIALGVTVYGASKCIDDDDMSIILFRDGTKIKIENCVQFNCDRNFTILFKESFGKHKEFNLLKTKEIEAMRIDTHDGYVQKDFTTEQSQTLMELIKQIEEYKF